MIQNDAMSLVDSVIETYRHLKTYRDAGLVSAWNERTRTDDMFSTQFLSPQRFRFDYLSSHPDPELSGEAIYHGIVLNELGVFSYIRHFDSKGNMTEVRSIGDAVARLAGVSFGAVHMIARLLLDEVPGMSLRDFVGFRLAEDLVVSGIPCKHVHCSTPMGQSVLAIESASLLIRRVTHNNPKFQCEESRSEVSINGDIDEKVFVEPFVESLRWSDESSQPA